MRISDWSSDVCSSDLRHGMQRAQVVAQPPAVGHADFRPAGLQYQYLGADAARIGHDEANQPAEQGAAEGQAGQIGRASCRERGCQYVSISVVAVALKKKIKQRE